MVRGGAARRERRNEQESKTVFAFDVDRAPGSEHVQCSGGTANPEPVAVNGSKPIGPIRQLDNDQEEEKEEDHGRFDGGGFDRTIGADRAVG